VKSDEGAFFWARQESSKTESISELFPPFAMKASVYGDRPKNTAWVLLRRKCGNIDF
jgi:hypothetical protein